MNARGAFITLEGPEGSGKSTQAALLGEWLCSRGLEVVLTAEPGGDTVAREIRAIVLHSRDEIVPESELLLYLAARAQHVRRVILPALERGAVVLSDRYADSSVAYQGYGRGIDIEVLRRLNEFATGGLVPDLTILLDMPVELGLAREQEKTRFDAESVGFHGRVRNGFLDLARSEPERWVVVDATGTVDSVAEKVREAVEMVIAPMER